MGDPRFRCVHITSDPDRLWIWARAVYRDENMHTWLPVIIKAESSLQVLMRQEDVPLGEPMSPTQLTAYQLPLMWQLYPGRMYRGTDSRMWRVVYHIKFRDVEDMLLEQLPSME